MLYLTGVILGIFLCFGTTLVLAGSLDPPAAPTSPDSAMYTLDDIYKRLNDGTAGSKRSVAFTQPSAGPTVGTGHTLDEVMGKAPSVDDTNGAGVADVLVDKKFWGLTGGGWGIKTGTMPYQDGDNASTARAQSGGVNYFTAPEGYYDGDDRVFATDAQVAALDTDISAGNIRSTVTIFGVAGDSSVVNTSSGDAAQGDILSGKKAWVDGSEVTGNISAGSNVSGGAGLKTFTIPNGLYSGSKTATANDTNLAEGNIKDGVVIFGVTGTFPSDGTTVAGEVKTGSTFYTSSAAKLTGNGTKTLSAADDNVAEGYYAVTTLSAVDMDLTQRNIKKDVVIFGVTGTYPLAAAARTGQTPTVPFNAPTGSDGDLQKGVPWPNPRFTDNTGDETGTVTDNLTGLMWAKDANTPDEARTWSNALADCNGLTLGGHSDWRLPNVRELLSLIDWSQRNPALPSSHPFSNVVSGYYWSSTTSVEDTGEAWYVSMRSGYVDDSNKSSLLFQRYVWPVRGGQ